LTNSFIWFVFSPWHFDFRLKIGCLSRKGGYARAIRHCIAGHVWHITRRCNKQELEKVGNRIREPKSPQEQDSVLSLCEPANPYRTDFDTKIDRLGICEGPF